MTSAGASGDFASFHDASRDVGLEARADGVDLGQQADVAVGELRGETDVEVLHGLADRDEGDRIGDDGNEPCLLSSVRPRGQRRTHVD